MEQKIFAYSSRRHLLSSLFFLFLIVSPSFGQANQKNEKKAPEVVYPLYNGISISTDLYGIGSKVLGGDILTAEIAVEANLKNRFFPIAEIGYGTTNTRSDNTNILYKSSSPYFKIGMNYNTMYKKNNKGHLYVGLRYAFSPMSYDIESIDLENGTDTNPNLEDGVWGTTRPGFDHKGLKATMHWFELVCGVKVHIYKQIYMGWSVRMKYRITASPSEYGDPWMVPGFGTYDTSKMGITYSLIYKLPF
ncbi:DUF6048 family protein [Bacteroides sp. 519]|uniref:DUF6048 family protein n=1 Tax=Bacteroides sp. 519 TaxID=2302937 RepID=UPI0013D7835D|nr:DUF6048 family protein [Bacteroides sp. 519]NDV59096.1 hypothetical protein [Bacteroides sp. 519]